jgi:hypothetical protein
MEGCFMLIKVGDTIRTAFCTGVVEEVIENHPASRSSLPHFRIKVTKPKLHWRRRHQIIRMDEVKGVQNED